MIQYIVYLNHSMKMASWSSWTPRFGYSTERPLDYEAVKDRKPGPHTTIVHHHGCYIHGEYGTEIKKGHKARGD